MDIAKMLQDMESNLSRINARVDGLIQRNAELEAENSELKKDNQVFRNYIDNESISKGALRNLLGENPLMDEAICMDEAIWEKL